MTSRSSDKATNRTIVGAFLRAAGIPIQENAVHDADEPSPDILCTFTDGTRVAFELTEAVDQQVAQNVRVSPASREKMREYYENELTLGEQTRLHDTLGNAHIAVHTKRGTSDRKFEQILRTLFHLLLACSGDVQGRLKLDTFPNCVEAIYITRGKWSCGPLFDRGTPALWVGEPVVEQIKKKFSKPYRCDCPIELLVYSKTYPLPPDDLWKGGVADFVAQNVDVSPFCRVSVFDCIDSTIRYAYPERRLSPVA